MWFSTINCGLYRREAYHLGFNNPTPQTEDLYIKSINANGVAPACPYGYFSYAPHNCAPDGYYGPEWFNRGVFIGAGPWFHGSNDFQGKVDNTFDPQYGYSGPLPKVGDKPAAQRKAPEQFKGNEVRDGRGDIRGGLQGSGRTLPAPANFKTIRLRGRALLIR